MAENELHISVPARCIDCPNITAAPFSMEKRGVQVFLVYDCPNSAFCERLFNHWNDLLRKKLEEIDAPYTNEQKEKYK